MIIVISGPSGAGKGTVCSRILERNPGIELSRSWTTRARRPGEREDAYHFVTREDFEQHIAEGGFLEHAEYVGNYYGSPIPDSRSLGEEDIIFEIELEGAEQVHALFGDENAIYFFIDTPDEAVQEARLRKRGDAEDQIKSRVAKGRSERERAQVFMYRIINDRLPETVMELEMHIAQARQVRGHTNST